MQAAGKNSTLGRVTESGFEALLRTQGGDPTGSSGLHVDREFNAVARFGLRRCVPSLLRDTRNGRADR